MDKERIVLLVITGVAAALAGAFLQNKAPQSEANQVTQVQVAPNAISSGEDLIRLLKTGQLKRPDGVALIWKKPSEKTRLSVINFWATWCAPCVEEMPELERLSKSLPPQTIVGLAIDNAANVSSFLQKTQVTYPVAIAGLDGAEIMRALGNQTGGLPYTVVLDEKGKVVFSKAGKTSGKRDESTVYLT